MWITNNSAFRLRPIRLAENVTVISRKYTWTHGAIAAGAIVKVTVCPVIPGNTTTACSSFNVTVVK